jgi:hypothetical protein
MEAILENEIMYILDPLKIMQKMLDENYKLYISHQITEEEYLIRIKPIDKSIEKMEMNMMERKLVLSN